ncbi:MAG: OsmC family protein [Ferruginibacter sp.]
MATHSVTTVFNRNMLFTANVTGFDVLMNDGEDDNGASPKQMMLASLAGCTGMDVVSMLRKMKVDFSDYSMVVDADLTDEHPKIYNKVKLTYKIRLAAEDQLKMEKAVTLSKEKYCGVSAMFTAFAELTTEIIYLD